MRVPGRLQRPDRGGGGRKGVLYEKEGKKEYLKSGR
jgi:hypothetical protein